MDDIIFSKRLRNFIDFVRDKSKTQFTITCSVRDLAEQQRLYAIGRTKAGKRVTNCDGIIKKSAHQLGRAVDIAIVKNGKISWNVEDYKPFIEEVKKLSKAYKINLVFGADFKKLKDYPHIELGKDEK